MVHYDVTSSGDINFPTLTSVVSGSAALMTSTQAILSTTSTLRTCTKTTSSSRGGGKK